MLSINRLSFIVKISLVKISAKDMGKLKNKKTLWCLALVLLVASGYMLFSYGELALGLRNRLTYSFFLAVFVNIILNNAAQRKAGFLVFNLKILVSFVVVVAVLISHRIIFEQVYLPTVPAVIQLKSDKELQQLTNRIMDKDWQGMSKKEKINILQQVANHEAAELKLKTSIPIEAAELYSSYEGGITLASYVRIFKKIIINSSVLDKPGEVVLKSALHELRHAQQDYLADAYEVSDTGWMSEGTLKLAEQFSKDFEYKKNNLMNYGEYYGQFIERDAREYSVNRSKYYVELSLYWEELLALPKDE